MIQFLKSQSFSLPVAIAMWIMMCAVQISTAQVRPADLDYPHNHLPWFTIESDHFMVHYQKGSERSAWLTSRIAEEIYTPVTELYGHHTRKKVSIVLRDREDYSNGAAFFFDDKIEIWLPALDTPLRGTHSWLHNVITHEFTHIVQLGASMKRSQRIPAIYLQWLSYEDVRRPDVLYGFPNGLITKPFATTGIPAWFAEGTAQYQRSGWDYDYWDSHRDMILRTRILSGSYLGFDEMGSFTSKNSLEREVIYNQGFAFTIYLVNRFGEEIVADISKAAASGQSGDFSRVMEQATGLSGREIFKDWIADRKTHYRNQQQQTDFTSTEPVERRGFFNFHPQFSSGGERFGWLTNAGRDYARTSLVIQKGDEIHVIDDVGGPDLLDDDQAYRFAHGFSSNASIDFISTRFTFSPGGDQVVYSRPVTNRYGETYQDLFLYDTDDESRLRLTESARLQDPAWHPEQSLIAAVRQMDGTQNIVLINPENSELQQITSFRNGETVHTPVWGPNADWIYFATASTGNRNLYRVRADGGETYPVFADRYIDFRDPWIDPKTGDLYFSSDQTGIFNIYRKPTDADTPEQLTSVLGGAFMPVVRDEILYFSEFTSDGYQISRLPVESLEPAGFRIHSGHLSDEHRPHHNPPSTLPDFNKLMNEGEEAEITDDTDDEVKARIWRPYRETTTGLSVFPVIRFDNYSKLRGANSNLLQHGQFGRLGENLWRDLKIGAYLSSRDVTENLSIFSGLLIGPGSVPADGVSDFFQPSRINNLDRDLFLIVEHRGIPFIRRSWSPTISLELYNLKRNVRNGLTIEEFACTSCLPEERSVDIRYSIWEASLYLRSKLNRWSLLEFGATYSPYSVATDGFFSNEFNEFIPGATSQYFRGARYSASYIAELREPYRHSDIAPLGLSGQFTYAFEPGRLLQEFDVNDGILSPVYSRDQNHSLELDTRYGFPLAGSSTGMIRTRLFSYLNRPDQFFYQDYTGGMTGLRSYPYFAVGGQTTGFLRTSWITPLIRNIHRQIGAYTLDKVYAHLYMEAGNGWGGPLSIGSDLKTGAGAELRVAFNSYYLFPMKFFLNGAYGFNSFTVTLPSEFITPEGGQTVRHGRELLFYFGLTFDFDL
jgi:hypothetical protein